jgi:hypothetical protein
MRGVQAVYRITADTTTTLVQRLKTKDDVIYVADAQALTEPGLASDFNLHITYTVDDKVMYQGFFYQALSTTTGNLPTNTTYWSLAPGGANIWGVLTINGERIMYRYRDTVANTVSGLMRGTAGTAISEHASGSIVYNIGRENLMPATCQDYVESNVTYPLLPSVNQGDGSTLLFTAVDIDVADVDVSIQDEVVRVYVGGTLVQSGYTVSAVSPVSVLFDTAPADGVEVAILVLRGHSWYDPATPSLPLALTDTPCARFLRGEI